MNSVNLVGRLTADPEVRYSDGGTTVAKFTVAVDRQYKKDGQQNADFIRCVAFGKTAELVEKYFVKGKQIGVTGRIQTGSYKNNDGQTIYTTDVILDNLTFVGSKGDGGTAPAAAGSDTSFMSVPSSIEDELPFQ